LTPSSNEYYVEIDKRIRLEFPHKFATIEAKETTKPVQTVASAKRSTKNWSQNCEAHTITGSNS
jgi:hypothetical protein